jgi:toxin YoeB
MSRGVTFSPQSWDDYHFWRSSDAKMFERLTGLIDESRRTPFTGTGKVEFLKHIKMISRRINEKDRLTYAVTEENLLIIRCRGHYNDK